MLAMMGAGAWLPTTATSDYYHVEKIPKNPNVVVTAPTELIGASLILDGVDKRMLWPDTWLDRPKWRRILRLPDPKPNAAKAYLQLLPGRHVLVISSRAYRDIVRTIDFAGEHQSVQVNTADLVRQ